MRPQIPDAFCVVCRVLVLVLRAKCVFLTFSCRALAGFLFSSCSVPCFFLLGLPKVASKTTWEHLHPLPQPHRRVQFAYCVIASVIRLRRLGTPLVQSLGRPRTRVSCLSFHLPHGSACRLSQTSHRNNPLSLETRIDVYCQVHHPGRS